MYNIKKKVNLTKCRILGDKENVLDVVLLDIKNLEYHLLEEEEAAAASRNFRENRLQFSKSEEERERKKFNYLNLM